jgi:hypothetical protein
MHSTAVGDGMVTSSSIDVDVPGHLLDGVWRAVPRVYPPGDGRHALLGHPMLVGRCAARLRPRIVCALLLAAAQCRLNP